MDVCIWYRINNSSRKQSEDQKFDKQILLNWVSMTILLTPQYTFQRDEFTYYSSY